MYTGTLIKDLMATVERAERGAQQKRLAEEMELQRIFDLQVPQMQSEPGSRRSGINGGSSGNSQCGPGGAAKYFLHRNSGNLLRQSHRQFASGEGGRSGSQSRDEAVWHRAGCLFLLVFTYAWQHFRAIEYGYQIESAKRELSNLTEMNRALRLEDASLRDPERIDVMARRMGLVPPEPGQVIRMDSASADAVSGPVMASAAPVTVLAGQIVATE